MKRRRQPPVGRRMARTATSTSRVITATASHERMRISLGARALTRTACESGCRKRVQPSSCTVRVVDSIPAFELRREACLRPAVEVEEDPRLASARRQVPHARRIHTREGHDRRVGTCGQLAAARQDALSRRRTCAHHRVLSNRRAQQHGDAAGHHEQQHSDKDELRQSKHS